MLIQNKSYSSHKLIVRKLRSSQESFAASVEKPNLFEMKVSNILYDPALDNSRKLKLILKIRQNQPQVVQNTRQDYRTNVSRGNTRQTTQFQSQNRRKIYVKDITIDKKTQLEQSNQRHKARAQTAYLRTSAERLDEPKVITSFQNEVVTSFGSVINIAASDMQSLFETKPTRSGKIQFKQVDPNFNSNKILPKLTQRLASKRNKIMPVAEYSQSQKELQEESQIKKNQGLYGNRSYAKFVDIKRVVQPQPAIQVDSQSSSSSIAKSNAQLLLAKRCSLDGKIVTEANEVLTAQGISGKIAAVGFGFGTGRHTASKDRPIVDRIVSLRPEVTIQDLSILDHLNKDLSLPVLRQSCSRGNSAGPMTSKVRRYSLALSAMSSRRASIKSACDQVSMGRFDPDYLDIDMQTDPVKIVPEKQFADFMIQTDPLIPELISLQEPEPLECLQDTLLKVQLLSTPQPEPFPEIELPLPEPDWVQSPLYLELITQTPMFNPNKDAILSEPELQYAAKILQTQSNQVIDNYIKLSRTTIQVVSQYLGNPDKQIGLLTASSNNCIKLFNRAQKLYQAVNHATVLLKRVLQITKLFEPDSQLVILLQTPMQTSRPVTQGLQNVETKLQQCLHCAARYKEDNEAVQFKFNRQTIESLIKTYIALIQDYQKIVLKQQPSLVYSEWLRTTTKSAQRFDEHEFASLFEQPPRPSKISHVMQQIPAQQKMPQRQRRNIVISQHDSTESVSQFGESHRCVLIPSESPPNVPMDRRNDYLTVVQSLNSCVSGQTEHANHTHFFKATANSNQTEYTAPYEASCRLDESFGSIIL